VPGHGPSAAKVIQSNNAGCSVGVPATFFQPAIAQRRNFIHLASTISMRGREQSCGELNW
jgi:hypothetical protein